MVGANSLYLAVNFGGANVSGRCRVFSSRRMPCCKLDFGSRYYRQRKLICRNSPMDFARRMGCFGNRTAGDEQRMVSESVQGGVDVWASSAEAKFPDHLVVMVNGIVGSAEDWRYAAEQFVKKLSDKVIVHRSECNSSRLTFDGVDLMGERLAEEVLSVVRRRPGIRKISFVAHSLGGLVARYAVGKLYVPVSNREALVVAGNHSSEYSSSSTQCLERHQEGRLAGLEPMNFITFATPHLGSRGHKQLPFLCGLPFLERRASETAHWIVGRTGKHLFLTDSDDGKPPLLLQMVKDCDDIKFISALRSFKRRVVYANANFDHMVGWRTSSIRRQSELPKQHLLANDEKYPHIVHIEREVSANTNLTSHIDSQAVDMEEEMIRGLNQVPWERVDVSFLKSRQKYTAHSTIQVKTYWINSDGKDVIFHMIDNFFL
ncbi:putative lipase C4A8.10 [Aristolochia californica]|uniref:putative lipase C4A8.10 n=1 Tax=Aristolochia californica TaxID=171875 RepID=UPI0035DF9B1F